MRIGSAAAICASLLLSVATPAAAVTLDFQTSVRNQTAVWGTAGNDMFFTFGTGSSKVKVHASAWTATVDSKGNYASISKAYLGDYEHGLGATSTSDFQGSYNLHTIDNYTSYDFVLLQFDRYVTLNNATLSPWEIGAGTSAAFGYVDADVRVGYGNSKADYSYDMAPSASSLAGLVTTFYSVQTPSTAKLSAGTNYVTDLTPAATPKANAWLIGADTLRAMSGKGDAKYDAFKLASVAADVGGFYDPIPEPATWATMMLGFGMAGTALRRRRRGVAAAA